MLVNHPDRNGVSLSTHSVLVEAVSGPALYSSFRNNLSVRHSLRIWPVKSTRQRICWFVPSLRLDIAQESNDLADRTTLLSPTAGEDDTKVVMPTEIEHERDLSHLKELSSNGVYDTSTFCNYNDRPRTPERWTGIAWGRQHLNGNDRQIWNMKRA